MDYQCECGLTFEWVYDLIQHIKNANNIHEKGSLKPHNCNHQPKGIFK